MEPMKKQPKVSIIITNYNGMEVLPDCMKSVSKIDYPNFEVVLVDDVSKDKSIEAVEHYKKKIDLTIVRNKKNLGFAGANNEGLKHANGDYILLLNNDTTVDKCLLTKLVERFEKDTSIGAGQAKIYLMDKPTHLDNAGAFLTRTGFLAHWGFMERDSKEYKKEREIFSAKGACLFIKREVLDKVGLFDGDYGSYMEETDFCWRVWLAGWRIIYFPETFIHHKVGFTFSKQFNPVTVNYNSFKNRIVTLYKNLETKNLFTIFMPHLLLVAGIGIYYLAMLQFSKASMIGKAFWWNIINAPRSIKKRKRVQRMRTKTDKELFKTILHKTNFTHMLGNFVRVEKDMKKK